MTRYRSTKIEVEALGAFVKLLRAAESVSATVHRHLDENGLSVSQFGVLEALFHLGPLCHKEIGEKILKSASNITLVIRNLEKRGLVVRRQNKDDRRYSTIALTDSGAALIENIFPAHSAGIVEQMSRLDRSELKTLSHLCRKLGKLE